MRFKKVSGHSLLRNHWALHWLSLPLLFFILNGCQSGSKSGNIKPPPHYSPPEPLALTSLASNTSPVLSKDGKRILYISRERTQHTHAQAYEMSLESKTERRLTYQDGDVIEAAYHPNQDRFFYSSTTDEIKENPQFIKDLKSQMSAQAKPIPTQKNLLGEPLPPTEIYMSSMAGDDIRRLTTRVGFDGHLSLKPKSSELLFVNYEGKSKLNTLNYQSTAIGSLGITADTIEGAVHSPDGKSLVWVQRQDEQIEMRLGDSRGRNSRRLLEKSAIYLNPNWSPDGKEILFSSNMDDKKNFELYSIHSDGTCLRRLTYHSANEDHPQFTPDQKEIVFSSDRTGPFQIYVMKYLPPPCPDADAQVPSGA